MFIVGNVRLDDCLAPWFCVHNLIFFFIRFYVDCIESLCDALNISPSPLIAFDVQIVYLRKIQNNHNEQRQ